jgi:hypothetical protein
LDSEGAAYINEIRKVFRDANYSDSEPIVGLLWRWNASEVFWAEGQAPPSGMVTLWGYPNSTQLAIANLQHYEGFDFDRAWLILSDESGLEDQQLYQVQEVLDFLEERSGLCFPEDYLEVATVSDSKIFRPLQTKCLRDQE